MINIIISSETFYLITCASKNSTLSGSNSSSSSSKTTAGIDPSVSSANSKKIELGSSSTPVKSERGLGGRNFGGLPLRLNVFPVAEAIDFRYNFSPKKFLLLKNLSLN